MSIENFYSNTFGNAPRRIRRATIKKRETLTRLAVNRANCCAPFNSRFSQKKKKIVNMYRNRMRYYQLVRVVTSERTWLVVSGMFIELSFQNMNLTGEKGECLDTKNREKLGFIYLYLWVFLLLAVAYLHRIKDWQ